MTTQKAVAMEAKLLAVLSAGLSGVRVTDLCAELGISRQTFYKYRRRFGAEGPAGLVERSRTPRSSPQAISGELEDEIVRLRKTLEVDNGAQMIAYHLERGGWPVPATSTIHRALVRRGLVTPQPAKRPRSAVRRFQWPRPNDAWQIDATLWALADGRDVWIMDVLDDHSRVLAAARVCEGPTAQAAWDALCCAAGRWGLPAHLMSDNGSCFTARLDPRPRGAEVDFERDLRALGIRHIPSTPGHPQTCGKLERSHQTTKRWLAAQPAAATPEQLQRQLDCWLRRYNHDRPHRALGGATPAEAWHAADRARPGPPIPELPHSHLKTVTKTGVVQLPPVRHQARRRVPPQPRPAHRPRRRPRHLRPPRAAPPPHPQPRPALLPQRPAPRRAPPTPYPQPQRLMSAMSRHTRQRCRATSHAHI